ncbi:hypothetical protein SKAU_G00287370 [Synaphobranchus kaupii]|uniref:Transmembrane protein n=1 Tax=Synaphobranchus kaupii TaxID=118154 RepID=A0A9Q1IPB7_SYNKA|nr:hypothetical protein SKAU_G00287370 [Synaphobranchus kaupii]
MKGYNKLIIRVSALLLLPFPVLLAIPLPASHNVTGEQHNGSAAATAQSLTTDSHPTVRMENITDSQTSKNDTTQHKCDERAKPAVPSEHHKLICFITLWALGVTAALFLGITVFLWIRLSVQRKMKRGRREGWVEETRGVEGQGKSLWLQPKGTVEERVEFWYANRSSADLEERVGKLQREKKNREGDEMRRKERETESFWVQPKVTLEEITEFWDANGRAKQDTDNEQI